MKRIELRKVVEKEYEDMRIWDKADPFRYSKLMYDTSDGEVWADCFLDEGSYIVYRSSSIHSVPICDLIYQNTGNRPMQIAEIVEAITDYIIGELNSVIIED